MSFQPITLDVISKFISNPWSSWSWMSSRTYLLSGITCLIVIGVPIIAFMCLSRRNAFIFSLLFLLWIGPIVFAIPILSLWSIPNMFGEDANITVGCGRGEGGKLVCM